jgi:putative hemolysin
MVEWIDIHDSKEEIFKKIQESVHSKFVVADGALDTVVGILKIRDFLESMENEFFDLRKILCKPIIITQSTPAIQILNTFKKKKEYIAIVIDEFGGTEGIITLHDLMEVIIGDLPDEDEETGGNIVMSSEGQYLVNGRTLIYEINQYFQDDVIEDNSAEYTTLSGFILSTLGHLPKTGEKFLSESGFEFQVVDMDGVRIDKVMMRKSQTEEIED